MLQLQRVGGLALCKNAHWLFDNGLWTLQAGIFPENEASVRLHKSCGFREVGRRERIGKVGDRWRDTVLVERRSQTVPRT